MSRMTHRASENRLGTADADAHGPRVSERIPRSLIAGTPDVESGPQLSPGRCRGRRWLRKPALRKRRQRVLRLIAGAWLAFLASGCWVFTAGTWENDPKNWERAFGDPKPEGVVVVHSKYWRSAHWTCEFSYAFEIEPTPEVKAQLFANNLRQLTPEQVAKEKERTGPADAPWFAPKDASAYDGWVYGDLPFSEFKMLVDRETGHIFLNDIQM